MSLSKLVFSLSVLILISACGSGSDETMSVEETVDVIMGTPDRVREAVRDLNDQIQETEKVLGDIQ